MAISETHIATPNGSKYLQQLCKHWSHKFAVTFTPEEGTIPFSDGRACHLKADPTELVIQIDVPDADGLERMQGVVIEHLKRFSFREDLGEIAWSRRDAAA